MIRMIAIVTACHLLASAAAGQCEVDVLTAGGQDDDYFGGAVSVDGDVAVIGAPGAFDSLGAAYVYRFDGSSWMQEAVLQAPDPDAKDSFAARAAITGNVIVIGAPQRSAPEFGAGALFVYRFDGAEWAFETMLTASEGDFGDMFGYWVDAEDDVIVAGAVSDENGSGVRTGAAYIFRYANHTWVEEARLLDPGGAVNDSFGVSCAVSDNCIVVGAHGNSDQFVETGAAFVFERLDGEWTLITRLDPIDATPTMWFGASVAVVGDLMAIGAPHGRAVYVYRHLSGVWTFEAKLVGERVGPSSFFGRTTISEDQATIIVGEPLDGLAGMWAGAANLFRHDGKEWVRLAKFTGSDTGAGHQFGVMLAIEGDTALISAASPVPGRVYVFDGILGIDCNENQTPDACDLFVGTSTDIDGDGVPDDCGLASDIDDDGIVGFSDLILLLSIWGPCQDPCRPCVADIDDDCLVGFQDLLVLLSSWTH